MDLSRRLAAERRILDKYFPGFVVDGVRAVGPLRSNSGAVYTIHVDLVGFPDRMPQAYVTRPRLLMHTGVPLGSIAASSAMHVLPADALGHPQVCHWKPESWRPAYTIYQVLMKVRIWLEAWEQHVITGEPLDRYLRHA